MDHFVSLQRIRACIRGHGLMEFDPLLICRVDVEWLGAIAAVIIAYMRPSAE